MDLNGWLKLNGHKLGSSYERLFVEKVLSKVQDIDFRTVQAQYPFQDLDGKNRYCDYVITEGLIQIAIEIDGYDKRNTGQGMTHAEFIDWQRRQAALTAEGWYVLRFANKDVRDSPERCRRYIELLLKDQRSKNAQRENLEDSIKKLRAQLLSHKKDQVNTDSMMKIKNLEDKIGLLMNQLEISKKTKPLSENDFFEKKKLLDQLSQENLVLSKGNKTMRTTIWAFTVIIGLLIMSGVYVFVNIDKASVIDIQGLGVETVKAQTDNAVALERGCPNSISWFEAKFKEGEYVTVLGTVADYRYMPQLNGKPTWINMGNRYPNKNRLSVVVWGEERSVFGSVLSESLAGQQVCIRGTVKMRDNTPQIIIRNKRDLIVM